jgi:diacylglycerol kinase (ATP)
MVDTSAQKREVTAIKVTLIHNPTAGDDSQPSGDQIADMIQTAGHKVRYHSSEDDDWKKALKTSADIVAVAGGDGTVGKVARRMVDERTPIAILPVGTANNVGHTLGLTGRALERLIAEWESARRVSFDVGKADGPWGSYYFIEGFGVGLFASTILSLEKRQDPVLATDVSRDEEIGRVLTILKERLEKHTPKRLTVRLDDQDFSGDYILVQALNIRYAGPNLDLAPAADTNDGLLDVVLLPHGEEKKLSQYLMRCIRGRAVKSKLPVRRGRHLRIKWDGSPVHIDDQPWSANERRRKGASNTINVRIGAHSVSFLCPQKPRRRPTRLSRKESKT